ncbi:hypothetical protein QFZ42_004485 [Variovorax paradoxus]|uniref:hypothetical protein n=1 Tax=Variovorax paradoxus TaxID=34073 RepID=UPI0027942E13|nr:hypothetical protein [Variovorax paradoxus]MDQ0572651.1 hypothetical protein [Variovorax paradoxus]
MTMHRQLDGALQGLQQLAYARIAREFARAWHARANASEESEAILGEAHRRVLHCEQALAQLRVVLDDPRQIAELKVSRALYLRMLLESAPTRLQSWSDCETLDDMPKSHLFEWISYDFEQLELAELEGSMTDEEAVSYARAINTAARVRD